MTNKILAMIVVVIACCPAPKDSYADVISVDVLGLSYHLDRNGANKDAPRALDDHGQKVFNPGLGIGYDFRSGVAESGLSGVARLGFFQDCDDRSLFYGSGGIRAVKVTNSGFVFGVNLSLALINGEIWETTERKFQLIPLSSAEVGQIFFEKYSYGFNISYVPSGSEVSATSGSDLIFVAISLSMSR